MMLTIIEKIIAWLAKVFKWEEPMPSLDNTVTEIEFIPMPARDRAMELYTTAKDLLQPKKDVSPADLAPDELACVESIENVYKACFGTFIGGTKPLLNTWEMLVVLGDSPDFKRIEEPVPGAIILNATWSGNGKVRGHVGICGKSWIMANNSNTSYWSADYTYPAWNDYFAIHGGMKTHFFKPI